MTDVYLEVGSKRAFASAVEWPGWCRGGRDEPAALDTLVAYGARYAKAMGRRARGLDVPSDASGFHVVERLKGNATTDFGAPGVASPGEARPIDEAALDRLIERLESAWAAFDATAVAARGKNLRKGPRGGGRDLEGIASHVLGADTAYLGGLGGRFHADGKSAAGDMGRLRKAFVAALRDRAHGVPLPPTSRQRRVWAPRYAIRRSAWHALDHAWEIEDRQ